LSFLDENIAGELFVILFKELYKSESNEILKNEIKKTLVDLLQQSTVNDYNFVSSIHKTMLELCKEGEVF